jgi:uncharacterized protein (TIGR00369 family)
MEKPNYLAIGKQVLASQPFSVFLNAELLDFREGYAELAVPITDNLKQQHGFVHGGVVSYAADNALTFAGGSVLGTSVLTLEYKINYLRPAVGEKLIAKASVVYAGKTQATCRCDVFTLNEGKEKLVAVAQGTIVKVQ